MDVLGQVLVWLEETYPTGKKASIRIVRTEKQMGPIAKRWAGKSGQAYQRVLLRLTMARAAHFRGELMLNFSQEAWLTGSIATRAAGLRTLAHEWWHFSRVQGTVLEFFEEGSAEIFAENALMLATGVTLERAATLRFELYDPMRQAVALLADEMGGATWLQASRTVQDGVKWLEAELAGAGFNPDAVRRLITAKTPTMFLNSATLVLGGRNG